MYILIALFIISIFIPFFWIFFFGYIAWLFFSKKAKRTIIMRNAISNLINSGKTTTVLPYIYYEAAQAYAVDCGATLSPYKNDPDNDSLTFDVKADNNNSYSVFISKWDDGSTYLSINENKKNENPINTRKLADIASKEILNYINNKEQALAIVLQLLRHAESDYINSYAQIGINKVANKLDINLDKYPIKFNVFYAQNSASKYTLEELFSTDPDYDPRKNRDSRLSGLDLFEITAPFNFLNDVVDDPEKCLEIKFFTIDSILKKWNLY